MDDQLHYFLLFSTLSDKEAFLALPGG